MDKQDKNNESTSWVASCNAQLGERNGSAQYEAAHAKMKLTYTYLLAGTVL
jgi:hypothetical protein